MTFSFNGVSERLFNSGIAMSVIPGFLEEVAATPTDEEKPFGEKVADTVLGVLFGSMAMCSAPVFVVASGVTLVGEKILDSFDSIFTMAQKIEESGTSIQKQEEIIKSVGPLLESFNEMLKKLANVAKEKGVQLETSTLQLKDLEKKYPENADLLLILRERVTILQTILKDPSALQSRVQLIQEIAKEKEETIQLESKLAQLCASVKESVSKFETLEVKAAQLAEIKETMITTLKKEIAVLQQNGNTERKPLNGNVIISS